MVLTDPPCGSTAGELAEGNVGLGEGSCLLEVGGDGLEGALNRASSVSMCPKTI